MSLYGLIYTDNRTSLVQNTDTEKQLQMLSFDSLIIPGWNFSVSQDGVFLLAHLANPTQVLAIKLDYFKLHSLIITLLSTFSPTLPIAMFLVVVTRKHSLGF